MRIRSLPLWVLLLVSCGEPPPPPPPPPTPAQRLDKGVEKLRRLAEDELKAKPDDAHLQAWVAKFKGLELDALPPSPLTAVARASRAPHDAAALKAVEETLPTSSYASLLRARWILHHARETPDYWKTATEAVEEALKRNQWDCPVAAFDRWALDWLERNEPDPLVRVCFRHGYVNTARTAAADLLIVAEGMAGAAGPPRLDAPRVARAARRLLEERLLKSPDAADVAFAHAQHPAALEAQFLLAWRAKDLETARSASLAFEDYGKRDAALKAWLPTHKSRLELQSTILALFKDGALKPPFPAGTPAAPGGDADWRKESLKELVAGAKAFFAALKADAARSTPLAAEFDAKRPAQSPKRNYLGHALRDREFLFIDPYPKDRHEQMLEAAFGDDLNDGQALGLKAYAWVIRDNLVRPASIPSKGLARRLSKDKDAPQPGKDLDLFAILRARKEAVADDRRPSPADVRKQGTSTQGYALLTWAAVKAKPAEAVEWLPEADAPLPSIFEVVVAETLRAATEKDFGLDWARWKAFLETGQ